MGLQPAQGLRRQALLALAVAVRRSAHENAPPAADVAASLAQRRDPDRASCGCGRRGPRGSSPPTRAPPGPRWSRKSAGSPPAIVRRPPTRSISRFSITRRSFDCTPARASPTSSRKRVPPSAPARSVRAGTRSAPVKAPFSWPKSSASASDSGSADGVDRHERPGRDAGRRVDRTRHQLLAGAALARGGGPSRRSRDLLDVLRRSGASERSRRRGLRPAAATPPSAAARDFRRAAAGVPARGSGSPAARPCRSASGRNRTRRAPSPAARPSAPPRRTS